MAADPGCNRRCYGRRNRRRQCGRLVDRPVRLRRGTRVGTGFLGQISARHRSGRRRFFRVGSGLQRRGYPVDSPGGRYVLRHSLDRGTARTGRGKRQDSAAQLRNCRRAVSQWRKLRTGCVAGAHAVAVDTGCHTRPRAEPEAGQDCAGRDTRRYVRRGRTVLRHRRQAARCARPPGGWHARRPVAAAARCAGGRNAGPGAERAGRRRHGEPVS